MNTTKQSHRVFPSSTIAALTLTLGAALTPTTAGAAEVVVPDGVAIRVSRTLYVSHDPAVAVDSTGTIAVAWQDGSVYGSIEGEGGNYQQGIAAQLVDADGTLLGGNVQVNTLTYRGQNTPELTVTAADEFLGSWGGGNDGNWNEYVSRGVLLREVFELRNKEAASVCGVSESVLRHRLAAGRTAMQDAFDGLCGLVSKTGLCHQCVNLRDRAPSERRGEPPPSLSGDREDSYRRRLAIVRDADLEHGRAAELHRLMFREVSGAEARARR